MHFLVIIAGSPDSRPINIRVCAWGSANDLEHVFRGIGVRRAVDCSMTDEIVNQRARVGSNFAKVNGFSASSQKEKPIEALKQHSRRLMDRAEDSLSVSSELLHEIADGPGSLAVKARRRLIQEEKQFWTGCEFDSNSQAFALFNIKTLAWNTNNGISVVIHVQQAYDLIDIVEFLLLGKMSWLTQKGAEFKRFSHSSRMQVNVLLLNIAGFALKGRVALLTINEHVASDDANCRAFGKDIQKCSFPSTRHTLKNKLASGGSKRLTTYHQGSKSPWFHPAINVVKNAFSSSFNLDIVADIFPVEN